MDKLETGLKRHESPAVPSNVGVAIALHHQGRLAEAEKMYEALLELDRSNFAVLHLLATLSVQRRQYERAVEFTVEALKINHMVPSVYNNYGVALMELKRYPEALASYAKAIELKPDYADAFNNRGVALTKLDNFDEAIISFDQAIALKPGFTEAHNNRGRALKILERFNEALFSFTKAIELEPDFADAHKNRGNVLFEMRRYEEAIADYDEAIRIKSDFSDAYNNRGVALLELKRFNEALASCDKAIELQQNYAGAYNNRGNVLLELRRFDEAIASYSMAIRLKPDYADAYYNLSFLELLLGRMGTGWANYEYRKKKNRPIGNRSFPRPAWLGEASLKNKTILIHHEQGLGDTIQFCRYLKKFNEAAVLFAPQKSLRRLMEGLGWSVKIVDSDDVSLQFDYHCSLLSLPLIFKTTEKTIPANIPYLSAEPERAWRWGNKLGRHGFKIGIAWQGTPVAAEAGSAFPVSMFANISRLPKVRLISLQKNRGSEQLANLPEGMTVETLGPDFDAGPDAFLDSAAVIENLDLVITTDTSLAHLAGALGCRVWVALRYVPDWRWMLDREDSPWYPTMRLFRQKSFGQWKTVFDEIEKELVYLNKN